MKKLIAILLAAILGIGLFAAVEHHRELKRQERERLERDVAECWARIGDVAPHTCEDLQDLLDKEGTR